jgi:hypothetical protein
MKSVTLILLLASSLLLLTPLTAEEVSERIFQRAEAFIVERMGASVYQEYVEFVDAKIVQPSSTCLAPDSMCDPGLGAWDAAVFRLPPPQIE